MKAFGFILAALAAAALYGVLTGATHQLFFLAVSACLSAVSFREAKKEKAEEVRK